MASKKREISDIDNLINDLKQFLNKLGRRIKRDWITAMIDSTKKQIVYLEGRKKKLEAELKKYPRKPR